MGPLNSNCRLVLASTSKYRAQLLERIGIHFVQVAPRFVERDHDIQFCKLGPVRFAATLAEGKARSIVEDYPKKWILGSDQVAVLPGIPPKLLHKPQSSEKAVEQLMRLSGKIHQLFTAVAIVDSNSGKVYSEVDQQRLTMRAFGLDEARAYVESYAPLDCVGSYRVEDAGLRLFDRIEGDDSSGTAIVGLPLLAVQRLLKRSGFFNDQRVSRRPK